ncbi:ATP-binding protein [Acidicapsa dinghuensis]|uniref:histidine kinase n=1 Tax=Acidicapsa dinghuensis TaxID=2218256 RepID=A0ABW1EH45_9BACT|nr:ATP-binding protein [Acidicapsa dinghuensis]
MRSTFVKIFLSFWLTEFLILLCTIFILSREFESNEAVYTSTFAMMISNARLEMNAYETGGCKAVAGVPKVFPLEEQGKVSAADQPAMLFDADGKPLCDQLAPGQYAEQLTKIKKDGYLVAEREGPGYLQGITVKDAQGRKFLYLMRGAYPREIYIPYREELPRILIGLIVSVFVTFGITMVITRPISSLREAARQLAAGNLRARAKLPKGKPNQKTGDELWGLVYDFNEMADRMESLVDAQMLLLRDVSHELRSPLARLSVALELAREEAGAGKQAKIRPGLSDQMDRIERETERLNSLIGQLLSLSHLESSTRLPDRMRVSLRCVVTDLLPDMDYEAQRRNCGVKFLENGKNGTNGHVSADVLGSPELLGRAVENVIRNAIAYTAEGTAVEIRLYEETRLGNCFAVLQVRDHGPGVPDAALKSIFRPFYRLDLSRQRSTGGYGVGLAITERAVRLHGGSVTARNAVEGSGLIVEMRLPAAEATGA